MLYDEGRREELEVNTGCHGRFLKVDFFSGDASCNQENNSH